MSDRSVQEKISDAQRIDSFLRDDVVRGAIERVERRFIEEMIAAETAEARARTQGKVHAIRAFALEMKVVLDEGEREVLQLAQKAKRDARAPK